MKATLTAHLLGMAALLAAPASAQQRPTAGSGGSTPAVGTVRPAGPLGPSGSRPSGAAGDAGASTSPLDDLKRKTIKGEWHMKPVHAIHVRVQADAPALVDGRFVSSYGKGDLKKGYLMGMDGVNTASVEGSLLYVQAEGINVKSRAKEERCVRKNKMRNVVFYEVLIAQPNASIAEFGETWKGPRDTFEYGPMLSMDGGACTPEATEGSVVKRPKACLQWNGEQGEADLGPFVGGSIKDDDVRAPYPDSYWFSFPNSCPTQTWANKTDKCRAATHKGLCDIGQAPDGVACTYAYNILGWVPLDDVVGITSIENEATGKKYQDFQEWCEASEDNVEFEGDDKTGKMESGLPFWKDPLDAEANRARAAKVVEIYNAIVSGEHVSTQINASTVKSFKPLPPVETLTAKNPKCFETVPTCNTGAGCRREGYAQLCKPCQSNAAGCAVDPTYAYPKLQKAKRSAPDSGSGSMRGGPTAGGNGKKKPTTPGASPTSAATTQLSALIIVALPALCLGYGS
ncbi:hypothetical protein P43SY_006878 [Pythium insidiosum]|uniref:Uncharacterized protein n=1 Tax=Pythium insidiosum TaxID=114742 RepID=A0AAD5LNW6_PYTIN|nr:hypothetical protein P43SY_006878 [Pythium insidiosum]